MDCLSDGEQRVLCYLFGVGSKWIMNLKKHEYSSEFITQHDKFWLPLKFLKQKGVYKSDKIYSIMQRLKSKGLVEIRRDLFPNISRERAEEVRRKSSPKRFKANLMRKLREEAKKPESKRDKYIYAFGLAFPIDKFYAKCSPSKKIIDSQVVDGYINMMIFHNPHFASSVIWSPRGKSIAITDKGAILAGILTGAGSGLFDDRGNVSLF